MLLPDNRIPTHPGEVLSKEYLAPLGITQVALAGHIGVPVQRVNELVRGKRGVTAETAWLLAAAPQYVKMAEAVCEYSGRIEDPGELLPMPPGSGITN